MSLDIVIFFLSLVDSFFYSLLCDLNLNQEMKREQEIYVCRLLTNDVAFGATHVQCVLP